MCCIFKESPGLGGRNSKHNTTHTHHMASTKLRRGSVEYTACCQHDHHFINPSDPKNVGINSYVWSGAICHRISCPASFMQCMLEDIGIVRCCCAEEKQTGQVKVSRNYMYWSIPSNEDWKETFAREFSWWGGAPSRDFIWVDPSADCIMVSVDPDFYLEIHSMCMSQEEVHLFEDPCAQETLGYMFVFAPAEPWEGCVDYSDVVLDDVAYDTEPDDDAEN